MNSSTAASTPGPVKASLAPALSEAVKVIYRLEGQRFIEPAPFVEALAASFVARGGVLRTDADVASITAGGHPAAVLSTG